MVTLDSSQMEVSSLPYYESQIVVAGPGTGKTTTSVELIKSINSQVLEERSVLFISFSRAAILSSFASMAEDIEELDIFVDHQTVDALAIGQLSEQGFNVDPGGNKFDEIISRAIDALDLNGEVLFEDVCHLIVDEAQDILGVRRKYLLKLIEKLPADCGISVFGDTFQTIYQFLTKVDAPGLENHFDSIVEWEIFREQLSQKRNFTERILNGQYRASSAAAKRVFQSLEAIRDTPSITAAGELLDELQADLGVLDLPSAAKLIPRWEGSTAILTRTNAEAIQLFEHLKALGLAPTIQVRQDLRPTLPAWLGKWSLEINQNSFSTKSLADYLKDSSVDNADARSMGIELNIDYDLSWTEVQKRVASYRPPPEFEFGSDGITIRTVHQSKGLEFDNVLVHNPDQYIVTSGTRTSELENLFVALSRGKKKIRSLLHDLEATRIVHNTIVQPHPNPRYSPRKICVTPQDIRKGFKLGNQESQLRLAAQQHTDSLSFEVLSASYDYPIYRCFLDNLVVGITTEDFGNRLKKISGSKQGNWPSLSPVHLLESESTFSTDEKDPRPFLIPRPLGFSGITFSKSQGAS